MELVRKTFLEKLKDLFLKIYDDNLFLLSSSISYYSALAIAPFLLILLSVASYTGEDVQAKLISLASGFSPALSQMIQIIFNNIHEGVDLTSVPGIIGLVVLFSTASLVFLQIRYALDIIHGLHYLKTKMSFFEAVREKLFAMMVVFIAGLFLIISSSLPGFVRYFGDNELYLLLETFSFNFVIFTLMFWGIHYFAPTKKPKARDAFYMSLLSSVFFMMGNTLLGFYFRTIGTSSIYGAAASLLVFLIWSYYSSFTLFLSAEFFLFFKKNRHL